MIDIRQYIINNFKDDEITEIRKAIDDSVSSKEEEPLIGLGVFFELLWHQSDNELKENILTKIQNAIKNN